MGPYSLAHAESALESWTLTVGRQTSYGLIVDGRLVGAVGFMLDDQGGVELAYWVRPEARGRGVAVRMLRSVTESAHRDGGVARLWLEINPDNVASQQVARKAGYRLEERLAGHCRSWVTDDPERDVWHDCLIWVHTNAETGLDE